MGSSVASGGHPVPGGLPRPVRQPTQPGRRRRNDRRAVGLSDRTQLDEFSLRSHEKAAAAQDSGAFKDQIVVSGMRTATWFWRTGASAAGHPREVAKIKPAFKEDGVIHAGNSGADLRRFGRAAGHVGEKAKELGLTPLAKVHTAVLAGADPVIMLTAPIPATQKALKPPVSLSTRSVSSRSTRPSPRCRWPG